MKKIVFTLLVLLFVQISASAQSEQEPLQRTVRKTSENDKIDKNEEYRDFRFTFGGGYARRLGKTLKSFNNNLNKLTDDLMNGFNIDAEGQYYFKENWGIGLNVNLARQSASGNDIYVNGYRVNNVKEYTNFVYVGPTFNFRCDLGAKMNFYASMGIGPIFFIDNVTFEGKEARLEKTAFASSASISADYSINTSLGVGLKLSATGGTISGESFGLNERVSVSNFMVTTYLSFRTSK